MGAELRIEAWISAIGIAVLALALIAVAQHPELAAVDKLLAPELDGIVAFL
jgi:hypothetical protein